jgi:hypothetical protein
MPVIEDRVELRIFGGFWWPDDSDDKQLGLHIRCH